MAAPISLLLVPCMKSFVDLIKQTKAQDYKFPHEVAPGLWTDELLVLTYWLQT